MTALFTLAACGGGGGGGVSYPNVSYSGVKTEADLTQLSDEQRAELGVTLIENGTAASDTAGTYTAVASTTAEPSKKRMTLLAKVAERVRDDVLGADTTQSGAYLSGVTQNQAGDCGGSVSVTDNSGGGRISGSVTYSDFCMKLDEFGASITMHGKMEFSGSYTGSPGYEVISALTVSIPYLKTTLVDAYGTYADVFSGDMSFTFDALARSYRCRWRSTSRTGRDLPYRELRDRGGRHIRAFLSSRSRLC